MKKDYAALYVRTDYRNSFLRLTHFNCFLNCQWAHVQQNIPTQCLQCFFKSQCETFEERKSGKWASGELNQGQWEMKSGS